MLTVKPDQDSVRFGDRLVVTFQRTLRVPDDGRTYPLPPALGAFRLHRVDDYRDRVPPEWRERGGVFIAMHQREALWIRFNGARWKPNAVKVGVGRVNAVSGGAWDEALHDDPQDYMVCPDQPWLDGINAGRGFIRQFVAMPLGQGYTVEAQVTGVEVFGGIQLLVFEPKPGRFPEAPPPGSDAGGRARMLMTAASSGEMGLAAGGKIEQQIYPDTYGVQTWDPHNRGGTFVHIVNSEQYRSITGQDPPPSPIDARTYTEAGYPWFKLYDEARGDLAATAPLADVASIHEIDVQHGKASDEQSLDVPDAQIKKLGGSDAPP